jgi:hypothetical protein
MIAGRLDDLKLLRLSKQSSVMRRAQTGSWLELMVYK